MINSIVDFTNLEIAAKETFKNKKRTKEAYNFFLNLHTNLENIRNDILNNSYKCDEFRVFSLKRKKQREIKAPSFRDCVTQRAIFNVLEKTLKLSNNVYSQRRSSILKGLKSIQNRIKKNRNSYYLKVDVNKFFKSIKREVLERLLLQKYDKELVELLLKFYHKELALGNLLSHFFGLIILKEIDTFLERNNLIFARFCDDLVVFNLTWQNALKLYYQLVQECGKLELSLSLVSIKRHKRGLFFCGFFVYENDIFVSRYIKNKHKKYQNQQSILNYIAKIKTN